MMESSERCWMVRKVLGVQICAAVMAITASVLKGA
jgi:hypothetical protein